MTLRPRGYPPDPPTPPGVRLERGATQSVPFVTNLRIVEASQLDGPGRTAFTPKKVFVNLVLEVGGRQGPP